MAGNQDSAISIDDWSIRSLKTLSGSKLSPLGFASQYLKEVDCIQTALAAGINYFFSYNLASDPLSSSLKPLLTSQRDAIFITIGSESRHPDTLQHYLDQVHSVLATDVIDTFFVEYLSPQENPDEVEAILSQLQRWKTKGWIRYAGASTHNRDIALQFIEQGGGDVLMLRYNMAHRKAEEQVLPAAQANGIPVVAFTCTRWGSLLKGHPQWQGSAPTAPECYRYALHHPAIQVALTAPATLSQLQENLTALDAPPLAIIEVEQWQTYGDLVYGSGQDAFETQWL